MILIIDNKDSFTYNLYQQIESLGQVCLVVRPDQIDPAAVETLAPKALVVSPGPGRPEEAEAALRLVAAFKDRLPILGVCLGHQILGLAFGTAVTGAKRLLYGKADQVFHEGQDCFAGMPKALRFARYHSLVLENLPDGFAKLAWSEDGDLMAMRHQTLPLLGLQFHPESFMSPEGARLLEVFFERL